jgi:hypothetical protein
VALLKVKPTEPPSFRCHKLFGYSCRCNPATPPDPRSRKRWCVTVSGPFGTLRSVPQTAERIWTDEYRFEGVGYTVTVSHASEDDYAAGAEAEARDAANEAEAKRAKADRKQAKLAGVL